MNGPIVGDTQAPLSTRVLAGVDVVEGPLITAAIDYAQRLSEPYLFNHAMRSWLFAELLGRSKGIDYDREVVAVGTILHDIGLTAGVRGPHRFEVNGEKAHPLYRYLKHHAKGILGTEFIKWNFTKFLVDRQGEVVGRFASATTPSTIEASIERLLG